MRCAFLLLVFSLPVLHARAQAKDWLPTWGTAVMALPAAADAAKALPLGRQDVTLRQVVHLSQGGKRLRITFTNEFGTTPLQISSAHVAFQSAGSKILTATDRGLTFGGLPTATIAPGQAVSSDAVTAIVPIFSDIVITAVLPQQDLPVITYHAAAHTTTYIATGEHATAEHFLPPTAIPPGLGIPDVKAPIAASQSDKQIVRSAISPNASGTFGTGTNVDVLQTTSWYFLKDVEVDRTRKSAAVIAFGDSITDGTGSTSETNRRWPDVLAPMLANNKKTAALSVVNEGIGGNRILHEGAGPSAIARFDREVLSQPGVRFVLMLEGINDIGNMHRAPEDAVSEEQLIGAYTALAQRAHSRGVTFIPATILPYKGAKYFSAAGEQMRQHINAFIRSSPLFDGYIDFDKVTQDPQQPDQLLPKYDHGDHLHPSDEGYAAMGAAINLKIFRKK